MTLAYYLTKAGGREALKGLPRKPKPFPSAQTAEGTSAPSAPTAQAETPTFADSASKKPSATRAALNRARKSLKAAG